MMQERNEGEKAGRDGLDREIRDVLNRIREDIVEDSGDPLPQGDISPEPAGRERCVLGDFHVIREIGSGGMATVFEAEQISLGRRVALKILPEPLGRSEEKVMKFCREAEAAGRQSHPGIAAVYMVGESEGVHYIAQELVEGGYTLADFLEENCRSGTLPEGYFRDAARLVAECADALHHAHENGVIHRDVKPSNILLTPARRPKISDFGLAHVEGALALSRTGDFNGTPYYMSPEQAMSRRIGITHRTDIFSLGVTLYELLTLKRPFDGKTSQEVLRKVVLDEPRDPRKVNPRVPHDLAIVCLKAMEKKPEQRFADMAGFAEDLRRFLSGDVVLARPVSAARRLVRRLRRRPALGAALFMALLAAVLLIVVLPWIIAVKERDKRRAVEAETRKLTAIQEFLSGVFRSASPRRDGRNVTVLETLDRAVASLEGEFDGDPGVELTLRTILGECFLNLRQYNEAGVQLRTALDLSRRATGGEHPDTFRIMRLLAGSLCAAKNLEEAESLARAALEGLRRTPGSSRKEEVHALAILARVVQWRSRFDEAEDLYAEAQALSGKVFGTSSSTLDIMKERAEMWRFLGKLEEAENLIRYVLDIQAALPETHPFAFVEDKIALGRMLEARGKYADAERSFREALREGRNSLGERNPLTLNAMNEIAMCIRRRRAYDEAEELLRRVVGICREDLGDNNALTYYYLVNYGTLLLNEQKLAEAEDVFNDVLVFRLETNGADHLDTVFAQCQLGRIMRDQGRLAEAEACFRRVVDVRRRLLGSLHRETLLAENYLGNVIHDQGRLPEAEAWFRQLLEKRMKDLDPDDEEIFIARFVLANILRESGRPKEAESLYREALDARRDETLCKDRKILRCRNCLGLSLRDQDRLEEAEATLRRVLADWIRFHGREDSDTILTMSNIALVLLDRDKTDEAEKLLKKAREAAEKCLPVEHWLRYQLMLNQGTCLLRTGRFDEAESLLTSARSGCEAALGSTHAFTLRALEMLVELYRKWGRDSEADRFKARLEALRNSRPKGK